MAEATKKMPVKTSKLATRRPPAYGTSRPLEQLRTEVDRLLSDFLRGYWHLPFRESAVDVEPYWRGEISFGATPAVDIVEMGDGYKLTAELPGVDERNVDISFVDGKLTIKGQKEEDQQDTNQDHFLSERHYGAFNRSFRVPTGVDTDKIDASFQNGILTVMLPKTAEARRNQKKIAIKNA